MSTNILRKFTVRLFVDDVEVLKQYYPHVGYNHILRALARRHVRELESSTAKRLSSSEVTQTEGETG